jgi:hypothetical protein
VLFEEGWIWSVTDLYCHYNHDKQLEGGEPGSVLCHIHSSPNIQTNSVRVAMTTELLGSLCLEHHRFNMKLIQMSFL